MKDVRKKIDDWHTDSLTCTPQVFAQTLQHVAHIQDGFHTFQLAHKEFARSERGSTLVEVDIESRTSWSGE